MTRVVYIVDCIEVTAEDRLARPQFNDSTIRAVKYLQAQSGERLLNCVRYLADGHYDYGNDEFLTLLGEFGPAMIPYWLQGRIGEELYERGVWNDQQLTRYENAA